MMFKTQEFPIFSRLANELDQDFTKHQWIEEFDLKGWFEYWIPLMSPKILTLKEEEYFGKQAIKLNDRYLKSAIVIPHVNTCFTNLYSLKDWIKPSKNYFNLTAIVFYSDNTIKIIKENISKSILSNQNWNKWFTENLEKAVALSNDLGRNLTGDYYRYRSTFLGSYCTQFKMFSALAKILTCTIAQKLYKKKQKANQVNLVEISQLLQDKILENQEIKLKITPSDTISHQLRNLKEQLEALMEHEEKSVIKQVYQEFIKRSPHMALSNYSCVNPRIAGDYYNWAIGDERFIKQRVQATAAYPALISIILQEQEKSSLQVSSIIGLVEKTKVLQAIDDGLQLEKVLSEVFKVPRACVRSLQGISYKSIAINSSGLNFYHSSPEIMKDFNYPSGDIWERQNFWKGYNYLIHTYIMCNNSISAYKNIDHMLSSQSKKKHEKITCVMKNNNFFYNMKYAFRDQVVFPAFWQEYLKSNNGIDTESVQKQAYNFLCEKSERTSSGDGLNKFLVGNKSPISLLKTSDKWHSKRKENENFFSQEIKWAPLFSEPVNTDGLIINCLTNKSELVREGEVMRHCIGTYSSACLYSSTHVLSVKKEDGENIATVALKLTSNAKIEILQCSGFQNAKVCKKIVRTIHRLVKDINGDKVITDRKSLYIEYKLSKVSKDIFKTIGFDFTQKHFCNQAFNGWKPYLPEYTSNLTQELWFETIGLNEWLKEQAASFNPSLKEVQLGLFSRLKLKIMG